MSTHRPAKLVAMISGTGETISIGDDDLVVTVAPAAGGRMSQITAHGVALLVGLDDAPPPVTPIAWGSYPMVPWAGRIRNGRFRAGSQTVDLPRAAGPHAIHGVGYTSAWTITHADDSSVVLALDLPTDLRWPFGGRSTQRIAIDDRGLLLELTVTADERAFPATIGWHPWFRKPTSIDFRPTAMYRRDAAGIAVDDLIGVTEPPWDDCFLNTQPIRIEIDGVGVELSSDCDHWVVYDAPTHATCIEPQTGPPDAPSIRPQPLAPGTSLSAWYRIAPTSDGSA